MRLTPVRGYKIPADPKSARRVSTLRALFKGKPQETYKDGNDRLRPTAIYAISDYNPPA